MLQGLDFRINHKTAVAVGRWSRWSVCTKLTEYRSTIPSWQQWKSRLQPLQQYSGLLTFAVEKAKNKGWYFNFHGVSLLISLMCHQTHYSSRWVPIEVQSSSLSADRSSRHTFQPFNNCIRPTLWGSSWLQGSWMPSIRPNGKQSKLLRIRFSGSACKNVREFWIWCANNPVENLFTSNAQVYHLRTLMVMIGLTYVC